MEFYQIDDKLNFMDIFNSDSSPFRIGFLLIDGFALMSYAAAVEPLRAANLLGDDKPFDVCNISAGEYAASSGGAQIRADSEVGQSLDFDLVLAVAGGDPTGFNDNRTFAWLRRLSQRGVAIGGVSGGPVVLARAGLMNGRRMTVHWEHAPLLSEIYPNALIDKALYVIDRDRITCAGGTAPMDLMHYLISRRKGPEFARLVSDWFLHTDIRHAGNPQRSGLAERYGVSNRAIVSAVEAMENHIADPLALNDLARLAGIGSRQLNRLFREQLSTTTMRFYRSIRLDVARRLLAGSQMPITEIAIATGFADSAHLWRAHMEEFGAAPSAVRAQAAAR
ncbi:MAG: GlxA family transcriptional regulator [Albidovulum sp.]|nr:GlxA family transcriptional regulator [Albidovulum sp.]